jgi:hypothetical protein
MCRRSASLVIVALLAGFAFQSSAQPPENADPRLHDWFQSLLQPGTNAPCCSIADCRPVDYRIAASGYEVSIDARWVRVPDATILHGMSNPTGRGILCRLPISGSIRCFVPASET